MSLEVLDPMSAAEINRRDALEKTIKHTFVRVTEGFKILGVALTEIKEKKLYRDDYSTFSEYCEKKLEITRQRVYQIIDSSAISKELEAANVKPLDTAPEAIRELKRVPKGSRPKAFKQAQKQSKDGTKVSRSEMRNTVNAMIHKPRTGGCNLEALEARNKKPAETGKEKLLEALDAWWEKTKVTLAYSVPSPKMMVDDFRKLVEENL